MNIVEILKYLPHRYPFLLVDRVLDCVPGESVVALKNVTINEPFFVGHFPHHPVMPGVLIIEAMAQAAGILAFRTLDRPPGDDMVIYFVGMDEVRFKRPVVPGDTLIFKVQLIKTKRMISIFACQAYVGEQLAAEARLMCTLRKIDE